MTATAFAREIVHRCPFVDAVVAGEAEEPLKMLADGVPHSAIPNLVYRRRGGVVMNPVSYAATREELDAVDFARFDLLRDADLYDARWALDHGEISARPNAERLYYMCGGRGCTVSCSFCGGSRKAHLELSGRRATIFRSPERLLDDAVKAGSAGCNTLYLCFDPPGTDPDHYPRFFELAGRSGLDMALIFECYRLPGERFLDSFARAFDRGRSQIALSPDSASDETRRRHKGYWYSNRALERTLARCSCRGVRTTLYYTLFPEDGWPAVRRLRKAQDRLKEKYGCRTLTLPIEVEPASRWQLHPRRWGLGEGPFDFGYFFSRHQRIATPPGDPGAAAGAEAPEQMEQLEFLNAGAGS
jgi:hypothetical protein